MIQSVRGLRHVAVNASDGRIGFVEQVFFDDERWAIRYIVVETGEEFADRRVLVSPMTVMSTDSGDPGAINVRLTRRQVAESPDIDTEKPVSRWMELEYNRYFLLPPYWGGSSVWGAWTLPVDLARLSTDAPSAEPAADIHLRSSREVIGYRVRGNNGRIGHVEDLLFEEASWRIRYVEVDTRNWIGGRKVLASPLWVKTVSWEERAISLDVPVEAVRSAPEYLSGDPVTPELEQRLRSHYGREVG